jgi:hypothetical protein
VGDGVGEKDLCPSNRIGLERGDSVMVAPASTPIGALEGELSIDSSVEVDGVREVDSLLDADTPWVFGRGRGRTTRLSRLSESITSGPSRRRFRW